MKGFAYEINVHDPRRRILGWSSHPAEVPRLQCVGTSERFWHRLVGDKPQKPPHRFIASKIWEGLLAGEVRQSAEKTPLYQLVQAEHCETRRIPGSVMGFCAAQLPKGWARLCSYAQR